MTTLTRSPRDTALLELAQLLRRSGDLIDLARSDHAFSGGLGGLDVSGTIDEVQAGIAAYFEVVKE